MKKIYLHIGEAKTGTTAIQACMMNLQKRKILQQHDFTVLTDPFHDLVPAGYADKNPPLDRVVTYIESFLEKTPENNIIISYEGFSSTLFMESKGVLALKKALKDHDVKVIIYIRRHDLSRESLWLQFCKQFYTTHTKPALPISYKKEILDAYADAFGKENLTVRVYERNTLVGNDSRHDFLEWIHLEKLIPELEYIKMIPSLSPSNLRIYFSFIQQNKMSSKTQEKKLEKLKKIESECKQGLSQEVRTNIALCKNRINVDYNFSRTVKYLFSLEKTPKNSAGNYIPLETRKAYLDNFTQENKEIAQKYLGREDGTLFDMTMPKEIETIHSPTTDDLVNSFLPMLVDLAHRVETLEDKNKQLNKEISQLKEITSQSEKRNFSSRTTEILPNVIDDKTYLKESFMKYMLFFPKLFMPFIKKEAFTLFNINKFKECDALVNDVLKKVPKTAWAYYILGKLHMESKKYQIAMQYLNKAIELEPNTDYFIKYKNNSDKKINLALKKQYKDIYNNVSKERLNIFYYEKLNIAYTYIPKVACSTLKKTFGIASGFVDFETSNPHHVDITNFRIKPGDLLNNPLNIIALRNPYKRIISGYLDKIVKHNISEHFSLDLKEKTFIHQRNYSAEQAHKAVHEQRKSPTLYEFTKQLQKIFDENININEHFSPQKRFLLFDFYDIIFNIDDNFEKQWKNSKLSNIPLQNFTEHATSLKKSHTFFEDREEFLSDIQGEEIRTRIEKNETTYPDFRLFFKDEKMRKLFFETYKDDIQLYCKLFGFTFIDDHNTCYENLCLKKAEKTQKGKN